MNNNTFFNNTIETFTNAVNALFENEIEKLAFFKDMWQDEQQFESFAEFAKPINNIMEKYGLQELWKINKKTFNIKIQMLQGLSAEIKFAGGEARLSFH